MQTIATVAAGNQTTETPLQFGVERHLVGILTAPTEATRQREFALIILNAGVLHRVGPHRLHVKLARKAAELGIPALRMDLSGIGDSRSPRTDLSFRALSVRDAQAAMDLVSHRLGVNHFVLFGLCSGADNSLATALEDERVFSIAMVDPICYVSPQARIRKLKSRLNELGSVREVTRWGLARMAKKAEDYATRSLRQDGHDSGEKTQQGREVPEKSSYETQLLTLCNRGVRILTLFSGAMDDNFNGPEQLFEVFASLKGRVTCEYFPEANHTFVELSTQAALLDAVTRWLTSIQVL